MMVYIGINPYLSFILCIMLGGVFGAINATIITRLNLNAVVVTIGMQGVYGGLNLVLTKGKAVTNIPEAIHFLGKGTIFFIPVPFIFTILVLLIILFITKYTIFGRYMYAIGNSKKAAQILGINVNNIRTMFILL